MRHNTMVLSEGQWWLIERDTKGKRWAVNGDKRKPYAQLFSAIRKIINSTHPRRGEAV